MDLDGVVVKEPLTYKYRKLVNLGLISCYFVKEALISVDTRAFIDSNKVQTTNGNVKTET